MQNTVPSTVTSIHSIKSFVECKIPLFISPISAGFPSPAEDYEEGPLDLNEHLIAHPAATFFVRASGDSMIGAGIFSGDLLIVDRSVTPRSGKIIIAVLDGLLTVKRFCRYDDNHITLEPENSQYQSIRIHEDQQFEVWGVVIHVIHSL